MTTESERAAALPTTLESSLVLLSKLVSELTRRELSDPDWTGDVVEYLRAKAYLKPLDGPAVSKTIVANGKVAVLTDMEIDYGDPMTPDRRVKVSFEYLEVDTEAEHLQSGETTLIQRGRLVDGP